MHAAVLVAALVALALGGCGGGNDDGPMTKSEYERGVLEIRERFEPEAGEMYLDLVVGLPSEECTQTVHELHAVLEDVISEIEELRPPTEVETLQERFLVEARRTVASVGELADDVEDGELTCGRPFNDRAYGLPSTKRAQRILEEFRERGYRFGFE